MIGSSLGNEAAPVAGGASSLEGATEMQHTAPRADSVDTEAAAVAASASAVEPQPPPLPPCLDEPELVTDVAVDVSPRQQSGLLVRVCSWNVGEAPPKTCGRAVLREWLLGSCECEGCLRQSGGGRGKTNQKHFYKGHLNEPDVVAIGVQEVDMGCWAMWLGCCACSTGRGVAWRESLTDYLEGYTLVAEQQLMGMMLLVLVRGASPVEDIQADVRSVSSGFFRVFGNKGGIAARITVPNPRAAGASTSICFVNCHFAAKKSMVERRNEDHDSVLGSVRYNDPPHQIMDHDYVFWFGDLNYRLVTSEENLMTVATSTACTRQREAILIESDQLLQQMRDARVFRHFTEAKIKWGPTYKIVKNSGGEYDTRREPSYCDRILYYSYTPSRGQLAPEGSGSSADAPLLADATAFPVKMSSIQEDAIEMTIDPSDPEQPASSATPALRMQDGEVTAVDDADVEDESAPMLTRDGSGSPAKATLRRDSPLLQHSNVEFAKKMQPLQKVSCLEYSTVIDCAGYVNKKQHNKTHRSP